MANVIRHFQVILLLLSCSGVATADYRDDIGYTQLIDELGVNIPDGKGVLVTHAEVSTSDTHSYMPDAADPEFIGKTLVDMSGTNPAGTVSGHATSVGRNFYGSSTAIAPGISRVDVYNAYTWLSTDYLHLTSDSVPDIEPDRIANHSWVGSLDNNTSLDAVKRVDWVVEKDEFIQVVGLKNTVSTNSPLLDSAFNVITVGKTDGLHGRGTAALDSPYVSGRTHPELVAPFTNTSSATPVVAAAAALLVDVASATASLSTDPAGISTTNRAGAIIYNAERSEVVKAVLMAGASRETNNTTNPDPGTPGDITDYRADPVNQAANGLDIRFGAGQLNIYNSFHILTAGEQDSAEDYPGGGGHIGLYGYDYEPSFGGAGGSNLKGSYTFSTGADKVMLTAALAWNIDIADDSGAPFPGAATLYDMDLRLYDATSSGRKLLVESASTIDNTENIWTRLDANRTYLLEVSPKPGQALFEWDYALAWKMEILIDTDRDGIPDSVDTDDDNDGLLDSDEINLYGSDPLDPDTDGDGLSDGEEIKFGTNPTAADTDLDLYNDAEEITAGSDPLDATSIPLANNTSTVGGGGGGGGCTLNTTNAARGVDPVLPLLLLLCIVYICRYNARRGASLASCLILSSRPAM